MNLESRLRQSIDRWNLLESPFYQAWSAGTLPLEALRTYASEYGAFISLVPKGWESHNDTVIADEERAHVELWRRFAAALGTGISRPRLVAVETLVKTADRLFSSKASALGALYAFEAQQPATTKSKLEGLRAHYHLPEAAEAYFIIHADDDSEPRLLLERMEQLSRQDRERAVEACREMCEALRAALDGLAAVCSQPAVVH
jgi:pyrroloquinoline-quinone synthase